MIVEVNAVPLSVIGVVGKYACFVILSVSTFATLIAEASVRGYANRYREKTSIAVRTFS